MKDRTISIGSSGKTFGGNFHFKKKMIEGEKEEEMFFKCSDWFQSWLDDHGLFFVIFVFYYF